MILLIISLFFGLAPHFAPLKSYLKLDVDQCIFFRNLIGFAAYAVGMTSLCYAFYTEWCVWYATQESRKLALVGTILAAIWSGKNALKSGFNQLRGLFGFLDVEFTQITV